MADMAKCDKRDFAELTDYLENVKISLRTFHEIICNHTRKEDIVLRRALSEVARFTVL